MNDDPYVYPGTSILINKLGIHSTEELDTAEREIVSRRLLQPVPRGDFDLPHLQAIHRHLFQDIYEWAGEVRQFGTLHKGSSAFLDAGRIPMGIGDVHNRIIKAGYFANTTPRDFALGAARIIGDVNYAHPFREGNGRTQLQYLKQLGERAGHDIDLSALRRDTWIAASIASHPDQNDYTPMALCIAHTLTPSYEREAGDSEERASLLDHDHDDDYER